MKFPVHRLYCHLVTAMNPEGYNRGVLSDLLEVTAIMGDVDITVINLKKTPANIGVYQKVLQTTSLSRGYCIQYQAYDNRSDTELCLRAIKTFAHTLVI